MGARSGRRQSVRCAEVRASRSCSLTCVVGSLTAVVWIPQGPERAGGCLTVRTRGRLQGDVLASV